MREVGQCEKCKNRTICKFTDNFTELQEKSKQINQSIDTSYPFKVVASCRFYNQDNVGTCINNITIPDNNNRIPIGYY